MKKFNKEDLLEYFDGMCLFLANHHWTERDERAVAIYEIIKNIHKEVTMDLNDLLEILRIMVNLEHSPLRGEIVGLVLKQIKKELERN